MSHGPQDDLVRHSANWHEEGGTPFRPEDVIVAAFVQLRRIAVRNNSCHLAPLDSDFFCLLRQAETTDVFYLHKGIPGAAHTDVNKEVLLRNCNGKLTQWMDTWHHEMRRANGESFHMSFLSFFRLHVRLFLNSFGIQAAMYPVSFRSPLSYDPKTDREQSSRTTPSVQALSACYTSAKENLHIVSHDFASMSMLVSHFPHFCRLSVLHFHTVPALWAGFYYGHDGICRRFPAEGGVMILGVVCRLIEPLSAPS